jgi:hypothetical protein
VADSQTGYTVANKAVLQDSLPTLFAAICRAPKRACCGKRHDRATIAAYTTFWNDLKRQVLEMPEPQLEKLKSVLGAQKLIVQYLDDTGTMRRKEV